MDILSFVDFVNKLSHGEVFSSECANLVIVFFFFIFTWVGPLLFGCTSGFLPFYMALLNVNYPYYWK